MNAGSEPSIKLIIPASTTPVILYQSAVETAASVGPRRRRKINISAAKNGAASPATSPGPAFQRHRLKQQSDANEADHHRENRFAPPFPPKSGRENGDENRQRFAQCCRQAEIDQRDSNEPCQQPHEAA